MTVAEFNEMVRVGALTQYDGVGHWAIDDYKNSDFIMRVEPFNFGDTPPKGVTHVVWYNR